MEVCAHLCRPSRIIHALYDCFRAIVAKQYMFYFLGHRSFCLYYGAYDARYVEMESHITYNRPMTPLSWFLWDLFFVN